MKSINVTVAVSTLDRPDALARCLDALWSGDVRPVQMVIVDQSQNEATSSVIEKCRARGMPIDYLRQALRGLGASQNTAINHARCPIVAVIDDDCVPSRGWLAVVENTFDSLETLAGVTGRVLPLEPDGDKMYPVASRTHPLRMEFNRKCSPWIVGSGNNFALKREWFVSIGGCDERLGPGSPGRGGVDMDLFYRLLRAGAHIRYEPEMLVHHERQTIAGRIDRRSMYGRGMGACCSIWLRQRDFYALRVLGHWVYFRARLLAAAALRRQWMSVYEELLMLRGTLSGLIYGAAVPSATNDSRTLAGT